MPTRKTAAKNSRRDTRDGDVRRGGIVVDQGGRPITDDGGRPVFAAPDGTLVLDSQGTAPLGTPTATGTDAPPAEG